MRSPWTELQGLLSTTLVADAQPSFSGKNE